MTIYDRIKSRREELGMSQQQLAVKAGYKSRSAINKIETGQRDINQTKIIAFAKALNTTPAYLMGWEEIKSSSTKTVDEQLMEMFSELSDSDKSRVLIELSNKFLSSKEDK